METARQGGLRSVALVLTGAALFGTAGTAAALAPEGASPEALGTLRLALGALVLVALVPLLGGSWRRLFGLVRRPAVWVMAVTSAAYQPLFFGAVVPPGPASTLLLADPLTATILGVALLGESISVVGAIGLVLVLLGLVIQARALARTEPSPAPVL